VDKEAEMSDPSTQLPENVRLAALSLTQHLQASEPFQAVNQSQAILNADVDAQGILEKLSQVHQELLGLQTQGKLTQEDVTQFRDLQAKAHNNASIRTYALAQQAAVQYLREINQEISQQLGTDFASMARRSCGS
jgi:cell fate (sporulation/competence/biofilm development) regulator YlbF (YheA/YmcA/DUF963 family)